MKLLITAGPTREPIDPIRFISNRSSGKMGYAIAEAAIEAGHDVILITGPVCLTSPVKAEVIKVTTSDEMFEAVHNRVEEVDLVVMSAAVSDFKPAKFIANKIKKNNAPTHLELIPTCDILLSLTKIKKKFLVVGFAAETDFLAENAQKKLLEKRCNLIIGNDVSRPDTGMESDYNELTLFFKNGEVRVLPRENKLSLAKKLIKIFEKIEE